MSFSTGGLFINESVELAKLHRPDEAWIDTVIRAVEDGATSLPKTASRRRTLREISHRVSQLTADEREFFIEDADRMERQSLLWLATCRAYRFVREFAVEVLRERYLSYQLDLPLETFDVFFGAKAEWDEGLEGISQYRSDTRVSIEDFANMVKSWIDRQGKGFRLNFFVDEVGQYIADNVKLMTNLQTIAESLNTKCKGQAWIIVTAQQAITDVDPPPLNWSTVYARKRRIEDGNETT